MDLGANVLVVVALIIAIYLSRRAAPPAMSEETEMGQGSARKGDEVESYLREINGQLVRFKRECA